MGENALIPFKYVKPNIMWEQITWRFPKTPNFAFQVYFSFSVTTNTGDPILQVGLICCDFCQDKFESILDLTSHRTKFHRDGSVEKMARKFEFHCQICGAIFERKSEWTQHLMVCIWEIRILLFTKYFVIAEQNLVTGFRKVWKTSDQINTSECKLKKKTFP